MSKRQDVLAELVARVTRIRTSNDFQTNAGQLVFMAEQPSLGADDPDDAIAISIGREEVTYQGEHKWIRLPVEVQAIVRADLDAPWSSVEAVVSDIKTAVERTTAGVKDHDFGGLLVNRGLEYVSTSQIDRPEGSSYTGAAVEYRLMFRELWGQP